ncbi:hypothetical protein KUTeg_002771 [Tegillarca granosa]|uniref:C1q domain-containing protein n=1 Tax=Tegillarca granosa TaxID=220873 RepID=A0ABQ9FU71_TEGGR|nr:hypothetical protein KUTeg_002771 [Tegillarca granosa]
MSYKILDSSAFYPSMKIKYYIYVGLSIDFPFLTNLLPNMYVLFLENGMFDIDLFFKCKYSKVFSQEKGLRTNIPLRLFVSNLLLCYGAASLRGTIQPPQHPKALQGLYGLNLGLSCMTNSHWKQIAFSAQLHDHSNTSSALVFKRVLTNIGGGYNVSDGKFYCPKNGLYLFSVTLEGLKRFNVWADLKKNDIDLAHLHERGVADGYPSVSVTVAVQLVIGDQVWVKGVGIGYRNTSHFTDKI